MSRRLLLLAFAWLFVACNSHNTLPDEYYCPTGSHPTLDGCETDVTSDDGDTDADVVVEKDSDSVVTADGDPETEAPADEASENEVDSEPLPTDGDTGETPGDLDSDAESVEPDSEGDTASEADTEATDTESEEPSFCASIQAPTVMAVGESNRLRTTMTDCAGTATPPAYTVQVSGVHGLTVGAFDAATQTLAITAQTEGTATLTLAFFDGARPLDSQDVTITIKPRTLVEARGLWVNRWAFASAADIKAIMQKAKAAHFNQVYFQVRGTFDAYYDSQYEPWAKSLTGTLGREPSYDPLAVAVAEAHNLGLELHAWVNVFALWQGSTAPAASTPAHAYNEHPEWIMQNSSHTPMPLGSGDYVWASPGNLDVRKRNTDVMVDIATHYDVDGIHLDRIRYPGPEYSHDPVSESRYQIALSARPDLSWADWQREQVTAQVAEIYSALQTAAPHVVLSAAVIGIYQDEWGWNAVASAYSDYYQDCRAFDSQNVIDAIIPMAYWPTTATYGAYTDFNAITDSYAQHRARARLYMGSDLTAAKDAGKPKRVLKKSRTKEKATYETFAQMLTQINKTRSTDGVSGWVLYDYGTLNSAGYWDDLSSGPFTEDAVVPFIWWK